jgi:aspartyl-tRNA(Asn)/glutamyl-tRNA(Gln) amidotransferase subunit A
MNMPTVIDAARSIRDGTVTSEALTMRCIEAIQRHNGLLNAFVHLDVESALLAARAVDRAVASGGAATLGPLAGIPFGVKDLENCAGMPTTRGSRWFANGPYETVDDIHVARLRRAGAIPIGKTAAPEFGTWAYTASPLLGVTRNPWNAERTPGGSSGGSSAAVAAGLVPFCTASDGGGSIRGPAAFSGLPGLKPTYGRIPTFGVTHIAQNAVVGSLATTIADTALLLDVMAGPDARDRTCLPTPAGSYLASLDADVRGIRAAWSLDLGFAVVDPDVAHLCESAAKALMAVIDAEHVDVRVDLDDYIRTYSKIEGVDKFVNIDPDLWQNRLDELDPLNAPSWVKTSTVTLPKSAVVEATRRKLVHQIAAYFERFDVLLTPMVARPAFAAEGPMPTEVAGIPGHGGMSVIHGMLANVANLPAITLPAGLTPDGLPVGLQIIGPRYREDLLLAIARRFEIARPWPRHAPLAG